MIREHKLFYDETAAIVCCTSRPEPPEDMVDVPFLIVDRDTYREVAEDDRNYGVVNINGVATLFSAKDPQLKSHKKKFDKPNNYLLPVIDQQRDDYIVKFTYHKRRGKLVVDGILDYLSTEGYYDRSIWLFVAQYNYFFKPPYLTWKWEPGEVFLNREVFKLDKPDHVKDITVLSTIDRYRTTYEEIE